MSAPKRVHYTGTPIAGAVYVGEQGDYANPFTGNPERAVEAFREWITSKGTVSITVGDGVGMAFVPQWNRNEWLLDNLDMLRGRDLACECPLDQPCHADVLLELANREVSPE